MVNFGEGLKRMRRPGWEANYINYDALKAAIEHLLELVDSKEESGKFLERLAAQIKSVDAFVSKQTQKLRTDYVKLDVQTLSATRDPRRKLDPGTALVLAGTLVYPPGLCGFAASC